MHYALCTLHHAPCTMHFAPCTMHMPPAPWTLRLHTAYATPPVCKCARRSEVFLVMHLLQKLAFQTRCSLGWSFWKAVSQRLLRHPGKIEANSNQQPYGRCMVRHNDLWCVLTLNATYVACMMHMYVSCEQCLCWTSFATHRKFSTRVMHFKQFHCVYPLFQYFLRPCVKTYGIYLDLVVAVFV